IPELLQNEEPDLNWNQNDSLRFEYHYDILPHSVFSRLIVRLHNYISQSTCWRTGVVLAHENNKVLIKADLEDKKIFVWVMGSQATRRELLAIIRKEIKHIHGTIKGLEAKEKVPYKNVVIDYQHLRDLEEMKQETFIPEGLKEKVNVQKLLSGVDNKMIKKKIFLASSSELKVDREQFEIFINRKNKVLIDKGIFLELVLWEDFLDAMSATRLQDEYNKAVRECDIFLMLFCTKVGKYTGEEFSSAFGQFEVSKKPFIFTYFKESAISTTDLNRDDVQSLFQFKDKLNSLGHFPTIYKSVEDLQLKFTQQLDKLRLV
ncbi:MAG: COR domain-containing protein, partial [Methylobacter sp.]|nr:COR domain-containing protein [Methylobacter sp.]